MRWGIRLLGALAVLAVIPAMAQASSGPRFAPGAAARVGRASGSRTVALEFPLSIDSRGLTRFADAVSTPGSPEYGRFASISWLAKHFGASAAVRRRTLAWLRAHGAIRVGIDATGLFAHATMRVGRAERLFATSLARFHAEATSVSRAYDFIAPAARPRIPTGLRGAVTGVVGLDTQHLSTMGPMRAPGAARRRAPRTAALRNALARAANTPGSGYSVRSGTAAGCPRALAGPGFTPNQYLAAYGYQPLQAAGLAGQGERVALLEIDGFRPGDLRAFASCFGLQAPPIHAFRVRIPRLLPAGGEATLDLELLDAAAPGLKEIDVYESQPTASAVLRALTDALSAHGRKPDVISASLGTCEADVRAAVGASGMQAVEQTLQLAAATGVSVLAASGDTGSTGCLSGRDAPLDTLGVDFPASSPWVTGVGGTNLTLNAANTISDPVANQVVWNDEPTLAGAGGGGTSLFPRPGYQSAAQASSRREVPDVSMLADPLPGYEIYCSAPRDCVSNTQPNPWIAFGGTSAATPLLAGGVALVDQDLRLHGQENLGFVNPLLYSTARSVGGASTLSDVVSGTNDISAQLFGRALGCCNARTGYDEASGLGSVNLSGLDAIARRRVSRQVTVGLTLPAQARPLAAGHLLVTVSCSGECLMGAYAQIQIGTDRRTLTVYSTAYELTARRRRTIPIPLGDPIRNAITTALQHHERVLATIRGAIIDLSGDIQRQTAGRQLTIRG
ncbi:MAG TPA: S53 family peptidase [Solirubrobacteraceae bacterium]|nr:S53 family peptidase [Solirubrobacteraceae bacterium]